MKRCYLIFILFVSVLFIPNVFADRITHVFDEDWAFPTTRTPLFYGCSNSSNCSLLGNMSEAWDYNYSDDPNEIINRSYAYYVRNLNNDSNGFAFSFYPDTIIPYNANVSMNILVCNTGSSSALTGNPIRAYIMKSSGQWLNMIQSSNLLSSFTYDIWDRNSLSTFGWTFNNCFLVRTHFRAESDFLEDTQVGFRFSGSGNIGTFAFLGYQLSINGIDITNQIAEQISSIRDLEESINEVNDNLSSVERIAQDNSDSLSKIVEHLEEAGDPNLLGTQNLKFTDSNGEISVLPVYYPSANYFKFYNVTSNGYTDLGTSEQYDFNDDGGAIPFSTKYFYTNVSGKPAYPNGLGVQWTSSYLIPSDFKVNVDAIIGVNTSNSNAITSISKVYAGANVGFHEADLVSDFDSMITRLDSCPDSFTLNDQTCYKVSVQFTTKNAIERVGLVFKSSSNISLGNWLTFYGYDINTLDVDSKISATWRYSEDEPFVENSGASYALSQISDLFDNINDSSISTLVLSPLSFISSFDDACSPLTFTIFGSDITLPCGDTIFWNRTEVQPFKIIWNLIFGGFSLWFVTTKFIKAFEGWADPFSDKVEVFDL